MNTNESEKIDELLNAFLDDELNQRQIIEVQRLVANDSNAARRLAELEKVRKLLGSLPREQAPEQMLEDIKDVLEKRSLLGSRHETAARQGGVAGLWTRKLLSAAAMLALVAGFSLVIYSIVAPEKTPLEREPVQTAVVNSGSPDAAAVVAAFSGTVEFKTADTLAMKQALEAAVAAHNLTKKDITSTGSHLYSLSASREDIALLLADMSDIWANADSAAFYVDGGSPDDRIAIKNVTNEQLTQIINQGDMETQIKAARYFAVVNSIPAPGTESPGVSDNEKNGLRVIPKPVLTSPEKPVKESPSGAIVTINIVIMPAD